MFKIILKENFFNLTENTSKTESKETEETCLLLPSSQILFPPERPATTLEELKDEASLASVHKNLSLAPENSHLQANSQKAILVNSQQAKSLEGTSITLIQQEDPSTSPVQPQLTLAEQINLKCSGIKPSTYFEDTVCARRSICCVK
jgi:hypothetical protein